MSAPSTSTGSVEGTWRGTYTYAPNGVDFLAPVFVDCATQQTYTLLDDDIPAYCRGVGLGIFVHVAGVLRPDGDDEDLLDDLEVTAILEGPCNTGACDDAPVWSECGSWVGVCGCDPIVQNCPEGEKCAPYSSDGGGPWDALKCVPVLPGAGGAAEPCTSEGDGSSGVDTCAKGHVCWPSPGGDPVCVSQCTGTYDAAECPGCSSCTISGDGVLTLCLFDCSPLAPEPGCGENSLCVPSPDDSARFTCRADGSGDEGQLFDPCEQSDACDPGLWCAPPSHASECDPQASGCCLPFCDLAQPACPGNGQICVPWHVPEAPPTCDANLGHCRLP